jgi:hypothetical protein
VLAPRRHPRQRRGQTFLGLTLKYQKRELSAIGALGGGVILARAHATGNGNTANKANLTPPLQNPTENTYMLFKYLGTKVANQARTHVRVFAPRSEAAVWTWGGYNTQNCQSVCPIAWV